MPLKKYLDYDGLDYLIQRIPRTKIRVTFDDVFAGETATCSMGTTTYTKTVPATEPYELVFPINELGAWTIATSYLGDDYGTTIEVTAIGQTATGHVSHVTTPEGATVTPTDDIQTWLKCAGIEDKSYTTLAEVLADAVTFNALLADSNACDYMVRSTTWSASAKVPVMTSNTTPSGVASASSIYSSSFDAWKAFDGISNDNSNVWISGTQSSPYNEYVQYKYEQAVCVNKVTWINRNDNNANAVQAPKEVELLGSNTGNNGDWTSLATYTNTNNTKGQTVSFDVNNTNNYLYYRLSISSVNGIANSYCSIGELIFDGNTIVDSQNAMNLLGKYSYACDKLLAVSTWRDAICNSEYFECVLNKKVPNMTSNATPEGSVYLAGTYETTASSAYRVFDGTAANNFAVMNTCQLGYQFPYSLIVNRVDIIFGQNRCTSFKVQAYDGTSWIDLATFTPANTGNVETFIFDNDIAYPSYCIYFTISTSSNIMKKIQFYGRESLQNSYIPLVPKMTSNTTPSGTAFEGPEQAGNYYAYLAFDNDSSTFNHSSNSSEPIGWLGYEFPSAVVVNKAEITFVNSDRKPTTIKVQGSNTGNSNDYTDLATVTSVTQTINTIEFQNTTAYKYYRFYCTGMPFVYNIYGIAATTAQFYAKLDKTIVHSAPCDTVYYKNNGSNIPLCTTNGDGIGEFDISSLGSGTYTLYSSVAKDPDNLSNDYGKTIRTSESKYGHTTEMYVMPDNTLYWWGYGVDNIEIMSTGNGWSGLPGGYNFVSPTFNTNYIYMIAQNNQSSGVSSKKPIKCSSIKTIFNSPSGTTGAGWEIYALTNKVLSTVGQHTWSDLRSSISTEEYSGFDNGNYYVATSVKNAARAMNVYAILTNS